jgi:sulfatase maturation enzyme AslB (radical SAM superfamily)
MKIDDAGIAWRHHIDREDWLVTPDGAQRGYIQPDSLRELWFHTGTQCNLGCSFCLEGAGPMDGRIDPLRLQDAIPFIDEAVALHVEQFSFTGGEPFVNGAFLDILDYAMERRPCLVLTNGLDPLRDHLTALARFSEKPHPLRFRVSLDYPNAARHDAERGQGSFDTALDTMARLHNIGFAVSVARHRDNGENLAEVNSRFTHIFERIGIPADTTIIAFPELHNPNIQVDTPHITENCMTTYKNEESRAAFMCAFSKMVVKIDGEVGVYACTLVDDDQDYCLGASLTGSMDVRVMLKHHRCFACFASGASCSE